MNFKTQVKHPELCNLRINAHSCNIRHWPSKCQNIILFWEKSCFLMPENIKNGPAIPKKQQFLHPLGESSLSTPILLKDIEITRVNQAWQVDITYVKLRKGFGFLVCLIDLYSRKIMGWAFSPFLDTHMCLEALEMALKEGSPEIINSGKGCQFTSNLWCDTLTANGIKISMDGKGRWIDNVYVERLWRTIKWEAVYLHSFETIKEAIEGLVKSRFIKIVGGCFNLCYTTSYNTHT